MSKVRDFLFSLMLIAYLLGMMCLAAYVVFAAALLFWYSPWFIKAVIGLVFLLLTLDDERT